MKFPNITTESCDREKLSFQDRLSAADGGLQINVPNPKRQHLFTLSWQVLTPAELNELIAHYDAQDATFFSFFDFWFLPVADLSFGTGNGSTTTFTLPVSESSGVTVKVNGTPTGGTFSAATGAEGEDRWIFSPAPANGTALTFSATTARRRWTVYYADPRLSLRHIEAQIFGAGLQLLEKIA